MQDKKILPLVLSMSLPMVLSMLVNSLYNIVDSYFVAQISNEAMIALSLIYPLQLVENSAAVGIGIGINACAAYFLGAREEKTANDAASFGLVLNFFHGIVLTVFTILFSPYFLRFFTENGEVLALGNTYSRIVFAFLIPNTLAITFEKIFQAEGQMKISMFSMLCGCVANIILDPLMIFGIGPFPQMGIAGAAIATGIGQTIPLIVYVILYVKIPLPLKIHLHRGMFRGDLCLRIYRVGIPATLNMGLPSVMITVLNGILAVYSDVYVLILGIYYKLQTFIYLTANGIVQGIRPVISFNYGAGHEKRVQQTFYTSLALIAGIMVIGMGICLGFGEELTGLFASQPGTVQVGGIAIRIISMGFVVSAVSVTVSGAFEALGKGGASLIISLLRYIAVVIPAAYLLGRYLSPPAVWHAFWIAEFSAAAVSWWLYRRTFRAQIPPRP